jgi:hypothetical protein
MKKSILVSGLVAGSMVYAHSETRNENHSKTDKKISEVFEWIVETDKGIFTGTCLSINDVNNEIKLATNNADLLKKNITPVSLISNNTEDKFYTWSVTTHTGHASGVSTNIEEAKRIINVFNTNEVVESNIIESTTNSK